MADSERSLAVFIDFENLALGFQDRRDRFDITRVLERLVEKGKIVVKKSYADWSRFSQFTSVLHEAAIELIEIPRRIQSGKNSADIRLCVDAMDLAYSKEHINTFVILSGDSDFSPLVSKLKELGKHVIGLGMQKSTSELLRDNCDEFIYYEDLGQTQTVAPSILSHLPEQKQKLFALLLESLLALRRESKEILWSSMVKDTMKRKKPSFNETYHGYRTFSELLEEAQKEGLLELETDKRSRTYVVTRFGTEMHQEGSPSPNVSGEQTGLPPQRGPAPEQGYANGSEMPGPGKKKSRRRRRRGQGAGMSNGAGSGAPVPVANFQPVVIPSPGPVVGVVVVPSPVIAPAPAEEPAARSETIPEPPAPKEQEPKPAPVAEVEPPPQPSQEPEPAPAPAETAEPARTEAPPAAKPRTRTTKTTRQPTAARTTSRRSSKTGQARSSEKQKPTPAKPQE